MSFQCTVDICGRCTDLTCFNGLTAAQIQALQALLNEAAQKEVALAIGDLATYEETKSGQPTDVLTEVIADAQDLIAAKYSSEDYTFTKSQSGEWQSLPGGGHVGFHAGNDGGASWAISVEFYVNGNPTTFPGRVFLFTRLVP